MAVSRADLEAVLRQAAVPVHFQPIRRLSDDGVMGFEALARFPGRHSPADWLAAARRDGCASALDRLMFESALSAHRAGALPGLLFVNIEAADLASLPRWLRANAGATMPRMVIEVTEREPDPPQGWAAAGGDLRRRDLRLSLDDFRLCLSFVRHVRHLRPDYVKLDRSLLFYLDRGRHLRRWLEALRERGATLVAEGVHSAGQARRLCTLGIEYGQGFGLGRPAPAEHWRRPDAGASGTQGGPWTGLSGKGT